MTTQNKPYKIITADKFSKLLRKLQTSLSEGWIVDGEITKSVVWKNYSVALTKK